MGSDEAPRPGVQVALLGHAGRELSRPPVGLGGGTVVSGQLQQMGSHRVAWEQFAEVAKIKVNWIAYKGGGPALLAVAGGHVDAAATNPGNVKP